MTAASISVLVLSKSCSRWEFGWVSSKWYIAYHVLISWNLHLVFENALSVDFFLFFWGKFWEVHFISRSTSLSRNYGRLNVVEQWNEFVSMMHPVSAQEGCGGDITCAPRGKQFQLDDEGLSGLPHRQLSWCKGTLLYFLSLGRMVR